MLVFVYGFQGVFFLRLQFSAVEEGVDVIGLIGETCGSLLIHYVAILDVQIIRQQQLKLTIKNKFSLIKFQKEILADKSF